MFASSYELAGGSATVFDTTREAYTQPIDNLPREDYGRFFAGDTVFNTNWVSASSIVNGRDGLGPLFNVQSCSTCHFKDGRGQPPNNSETTIGLLIRISLAIGNNSSEAPKPHPVYGNQLSVRALEGLEPEARVAVDYQEIVGAYLDGTSYTLLAPNYVIDNWGYGRPEEALLLSPRVASSVYGLGLLDAIDDEQLILLADPDDEDGDNISGRPNYVWSPSEQTYAIGRYGWKANKASILDQAAGAAAGDLGITNRIFPAENHTLNQVDVETYPSGGHPELTDEDLDNLVFYLKTLAVPASRVESDAAYQSGLEQFQQLKCASCHTPEFRTREDYEIAALADQLIRPFTDLLLHDMGDALADHRPDFNASGNEWRTPPLWGIGLLEKVNGHTRLLHDGRARSIEEAILWHGGEAEGSREAFKKLSQNDRVELINFVKGL